MAKTDVYALVRNTPEYREWLARRVERHGTVLLPERYTFGTREDGSSKAPVSDGTNRREPTLYTTTYNGKTRASRPWHESNYSTGKRPRKVHTSKKGHRTEVYVPDAHRLHLPSIHTED